MGELAVHICWPSPGKNFDRQILFLFTCTCQVKKENNKYKIIRDLIGLGLSTSLVALVPSSTHSLESIHQGKEKSKNTHRAAISPPRLQGQVSVDGKRFNLWAVNMPTTAGTQTLEGLKGRGKELPWIWRGLWVMIWGNEKRCVPVFVHMFGRGWLFYFITIVAIKNILPLHKFSCHVVEGGNLRSG